MIVMAASMAGMMVPTAAPFFFAYGRDTRRPAAVVVTAVIYVAVWAGIGALAYFAMGQIMMPSSLVAAAVAIVFAAAWTLSPLSLRARKICRQMCVRAPRARGLRYAFRDAWTYAACCVACSAGVMVALVVLGMSNAWLIVAGAAVLLAYKLPNRSALGAGSIR